MVRDPACRPPLYFWVQTDSARVAAGAVVRDHGLVQRTPTPNKVRVHNMHGRGQVNGGRVFSG